MPSYRELLHGLAFSGEVPEGAAAGVAQDSRKVTPGGVFVCLPGGGRDGHAFAAAAVEKGAAMVVAQRALGLPCEVLVPDARAAYGEICQNFFGRPAEKLCLIGVTGTNGKTTVATTLKRVLATLGAPCGLIGTNRYEIGEMPVPAQFTTPEAFELAALLHTMQKAGCTHAVMETSSQALQQGRLAGLHFALGIFTNLTKDHLDYHGDMQAYFAAKRLLFLQCGAMLANADDEYGRRLLEEGARGEAGRWPGVVKSFSLRDAAADFTAEGLARKAEGVAFDFTGAGFAHAASFAMPGAYNAANALAAAAAAVMLGQNAAAVAAALGRAGGVKGRAEVLHKGRFTVVADFAHTADAMEKLLSELRPYAGGRMVVLYGCAGERERTKRPDMTRAALRYADEVVLTADNPRAEPVRQTIEDALPPLLRTALPYHIEEDREEAVRLALGLLGEGDMLVLCGKGHEDYQVMDGYTLHMEERQIVEEWIG